MPASPAGDPILKRFRATLDALYGDRIERVVLYGSRARGDAQVWAALRELVPRRSCAGDKARPLTGAIGGPVRVQSTMSRCARLPPICCRSKRTGSKLA